MGSFRLSCGLDYYLEKQLGEGGSLQDLWECFGTHLAAQERRAPTRRARSCQSHHAAESAKLVYLCVYMLTEIEQKLPSGLEFESLDSQMEPHLPGKFHQTPCRLTRLTNPTLTGAGKPVSGR